jgi:hypothetical protein
LRQYLMDGDFFIGTTLASTLTKLALKYLDWESHDVRKHSFTHKSDYCSFSIIFRSNEIASAPLQC